MVGLDKRQILVSCPPNMQDKTINQSASPNLPNIHEICKILSCMCMFCAYK